jgi:hypothetical protein
MSIPIILTSSHYHNVPVIVYRLLKIYILKLLHLFEAFIMREAVLFVVVVSC